MTNEEIREVFDAGQELLRAIHNHLSDRSLASFDSYLNYLYDTLGLPHACCDGCDAETPTQILREGVCPNCQEEVEDNEDNQE